MKYRTKILDMCYIALGAVLIAACAWITVPFTVPFTMQTFGVAAVLMLLGGKRGSISVLLYILLGTIGAPVFSGFAGGVGVLLGKTGGYIIGFVFMALAFWLITHFFGEKVWVMLAAAAAGLLICYAFGTAWFMYVYAGSGESIGLYTALSWCVIPFIIPDIAKLALAALISTRLKKLIKV